MPPFDTFDRGSYPTASLGVSTSGDTWEVIRGDFIIDQVSGDSYAKGSGSNRNVATFDYGTADVTIMCHILTVGGDGNQGLAFRVVDDNNYYAAGDGAIFKNVAGVITNIGAGGYPNFNTLTFAKLVLSGTSIKLYLDGVLVEDFTDSSLSGTKHGIYTRFANGHIFDYGKDELVGGWGVGMIRMGAN